MQKFIGQVSDIQNFGNIIAFTLNTPTAKPYACIMELKGPEDVALAKTDLAHIAGRGRTIVEAIPLTGIQDSWSVIPLRTTLSVNYFKAATPGFH